MESGGSIHKAQRRYDENSIHYGDEGGEWGAF